MNNTFPKPSRFTRESVLPNGAVIIEISDTPTQTIVLCLYRNEYVTWHMNNAGDVYWGHYYSDLFEAVEDFKGRAFIS